MHAHPENFPFSLKSLLYGPHCKYEWPPNSPHFNHLTMNVPRVTVIS